MRSPNASLQNGKKGAGRVRVIVAAFCWQSTGCARRADTRLAKATILSMQRFSKICEADFPFVTFGDAQFFLIVQFKKSFVTWILRISKLFNLETLLSTLRHERQCRMTLVATETSLDKELYRCNHVNRFPRASRVSVGPFHGCYSHHAFARNGHAFTHV